MLVCRFGNYNIVSDRLVPRTDAQTLAQRNLPHHLLLCLLLDRDPSRLSGTAQACETQTQQLTLNTFSYWRRNLSDTKYTACICCVLSREECTCSSCLTTMLLMERVYCLCLWPSVWLLAGPLVSSTSIMFQKYYQAIFQLLPRFKYQPSILWVLVQYQHSLPEQEVVWLFLATSWWYGSSHVFPEMSKCSFNHSLFSITRSLRLSRTGVVERYYL